MKSLIESIRRQVIGKMPDGVIRNVVKGLYWNLPYRFRTIDPATDTVRAIVKANRPVRFVQIGANDGSTGDYLSTAIVENKWKGILVEPHPETFKQLENSYRNESQLTLVNVAISQESGEQEFFYVPNNPLLASFSKEHVKRFSETPELIESVTVTCQTMTDLLTSHSCTSIDLLAIDTEGYDGEIIKSIDFDHFDCTVILFESIHLSPEDKTVCFNLLQDAGYSVMEGEFDAVAVNNAAASTNLTRLVEAYNRGN